MNREKDKVQNGWNLGFFYIRHFLNEHCTRTEKVGELKIDENQEKISNFFLVKFQSLYWSRKKVIAGNVKRFKLKTSLHIFFLSRHWEGDDGWLERPMGEETMG